MSRDDDINDLLDAYCEGIFAMDPRTTFPFWDYDLAPLFSREWIQKILTATRRSNIRRQDYPSLFGGPSVVRKELIYSLVDMKVARIPRDERLRQVSFWIDLLRDWCGNDWLSVGANRAPQQDRVDELLAATHWVDTDRAGGVAIGRIAVALNALSYSLYSDVFVHQSAECRGPYELPACAGSTLLIRSWSGLWPRTLIADAIDPGMDGVMIGCIYSDCAYSMDIYNHITWAESPVEHLLRYAVWLDGSPIVMTPDRLDSLTREISFIAAKMFAKYKRLAVEGQKALWVRQRNNQFRSFFASVGLPLEAPEMLAAVRDKPLMRSQLWNTALPKAKLFEVWKECLDPRTEMYADDWTTTFQNTFGDLSRPD